MTAGAAEILIPAVTGSSPSAEVKVRSGESVTFMASNVINTGAEVIDIEYKDPDGNWLKLWQDGTQTQLTATNTMAAVYAPGTYRANRHTLLTTITGVGVARGNMSL